MSLSSVYPPAPSYYKHFTKENLEKLKELQGKEGYNEEELEPPLSYLIPPKPIEGKPYRSFGSLWEPEDKLQTLESAGLKKLSGEINTPLDRVKELKKLLRSLLANYLELVGIMSLHPEKFPPKVEDIRIILMNIHFLLNEYRPHQSRENLITLMESQIKQKRDEIATIREKNETISARIKQMAGEFDLSTSVPAGSLPLTKDTTENKNMQKELDLKMWKELCQEGLDH